MELINLNAYVKQIFMQYATKGPFGATEFMLKVHKMTTLLDTSVKQWHFIPCDDILNELEEPKEYQEWLKQKSPSSEEEAIRCLQYYKACERVLFENIKGFGYEEDIRLHYIIRNDESDKLFISLDTDDKISALVDLGLQLKPSVTSI